jgi:hypothetical protein
MRVAVDCCVALYLTTIGHMIILGKSMDHIRITKGLTQQNLEEVEKRY